MYDMSVDDISYVTAGLIYDYSNDNGDTSCSISRNQDHNSFIYIRFVAKKRKHL